MRRGCVERVSHALTQPEDRDKRMEGARVINIRTPEYTYTCTYVHVCNIIIHVVYIVHTLQCMFRLDNYCVKQLVVTYSHRTCS